MTVDGSFAARMTDALAVSVLLARGLVAYDEQGELQLTEAGWEAVAEVEAEERRPPV